VTFLAALQDSGAGFIAADMPEANELTVHIIAAVAQAERKAIGERTKLALKAAKAHGIKLGNPNGAAALRKAGRGNIDALISIKGSADRFAADLKPVIADIRNSGAVSFADIAKELNNKHIRTVRGGDWHPATVRNLVNRIETLA
ncbi:MAG: recombinase family protein, partial [Parasphingorhabdus sp.]